MLISQAKKEDAKPTMRNHLTPSDFSGRYTCLRVTSVILRLVVNKSLCGIPQLKLPELPYVFLDIKT
ncbi:MAG TPA: hypothetical protein VFI70_03855 [Nitrososphaeraceae archaeon]|nr:hypothetical protein [Nitrososphaeraceae archaeon]